MNKRDLSERDICSKFISPAIYKAGCDSMSQVREEVSFTKGRIIVRGKLITRGKAKRADYVLSYKPNVPIALIEAKDNKHSVGYPNAIDLSWGFQSFWPSETRSIVLRAAAAPRSSCPRNICFSSMQFSFASLMT